MKKKLHCILSLFCFMSIMLCACGKSTKLIDMSAVEGDEYVSIKWGDRVYIPFCAVSKNDCGTQIGYLDGESDNMVCEYKNYPTDEWIASYLTADCGAMLFKEVNVTNIPDGLESEYKWNSLTLNKLCEKYPQYFELGTFKGLEVYVWQMSENGYCFGLMQGTNREKTLEEKMALKGATSEEMALILSSFDIDDKDIFIIPWQHPMSSYMVTDSMAKAPEYLRNIRIMLGLNSE